MADEDQGTGWRILNWAWDRKDEIAISLARVYLWFQGGKDNKDSKRPRRDILIIGPGGAGKTTLGGFLSGSYDLLSRPPGEYKESLVSETISLSAAEGEEPIAEVVIPPGQEHRRLGTWNKLFQEIASGRFRGIILISAYGYHSLGNISYKKHHLYRQEKHKDKFLAAYLADRRKDELTVLRQLVPHITAHPQRLWFLTLVGKQDLWWPKRAEVKAHYEEGAFGAEFQQMLSALGHQHFRHETVYASLVISNFVTGMQEELQKNAAGYDHLHYVQSLRRLFETIDSLREWEAET